MMSQIIPDHTNKLKFSSNVLQPTFFFGQIAVNRGAQLTMFVWVMEILLDMARSGIGKHYKCRIEYILDTILDKANNTQKKLILKTLSQSF